MSGALRVADQGGVRVLSIDHPAKRNALDFGTLASIGDACAAAERDGVRCIVFRGAGDRAFSSGFDIEAIPTGPQEGDPDRPDLAVERAMEAIEAVPCPTIAYLNGSAFGGGAELAITCDLRVAREGIQIGMPPAKLGVVYAPAGLRRFLHLVGPAHAREIFFTGRPLEVERAVAIGLVDRVLPAAQAEAEVLALAAEIAKNAPLAVQGMKRIFRLLESAAERALTPAERDEIAVLRRRAFESDDVREGRAAFLQKRAPRFSGR